MRRTAAHRAMPRPYRTVVEILRPVMGAITRRDWRGMEHLPADGGFVVCPNHLSHLDVFALGHFLFDTGRPGYFLAKDSLFRVPVIGPLLVQTGQIPVYRGTTRALESLRAAMTGIAAGKAIVVYPEGSLTRDPDLWPMRGKTGAARLALESRCPLVPVAMWGPQDLLPPHGAKVPRVWKRPTMHISAAPPIDLSDLYDAPDQRAAAVEATERLMVALTEELARLRGERPPAQRWDPVAHGQSEFGRHDAGPRRFRRAS